MTNPIRKHVRLRVCAKAGDLRGKREKRVKQMNEKTAQTDDM